MLSFIWNYKGHNGGFFDRGPNWWQITFPPSRKWPRCALIFRWQEQAYTPRPQGSNADEWMLFLIDHKDAPEFVAVQIAEAIEAASELSAVLSAALKTTRRR